MEYDMIRWVRGDVCCSIILSTLGVSSFHVPVLMFFISEEENRLLSTLFSPDAVLLTDRCTMERTPHPVSLATTRVTTCWARSLTVHQIACGWSSTATPLEPIRASASRTPVSCLTNKVLSRGGKACCFLLYLCFCSRFFFSFYNCWQKTNASLLLSFFSLTQAHRRCKCKSLKLK